VACAVGAAARWGVVAVDLGHTEPGCKVSRALCIAMANAGVQYKGRVFQGGRHWDCRGSRGIGLTLLGSAADVACAVGADACGRLVAVDWATQSLGAR
jgi:hypothetical protein